MSSRRSTPRRWRYPLWRATDIIRKLTGLGWTFDTAMAALPYYYFELMLLRRFGKQIAEKRSTWCIASRRSARPSRASSRPCCQKHGVPFVLGPINGGVPWPPGFFDVQAREGEWLHYVRDAYKLLPGYRSTLRTRERGHLRLARHLRVSFPPRGADEGRVHPRERHRRGALRHGATRGPVGTPLRVAFVGRLVAYKGADMLIEAAAELMRAGKLVIDIMGDGPEREPLKRWPRRWA